MLHRRPRGLLAAAALALALLSAAPPALGADGPSVFIRIEGQNETLLPRTRVTLSTDPVPGNNCPGNSVAGAIEKGTNGNWDRQQFASTILGESHTFQNNDYWAEWIRRSGGGYQYGGGICSDLLSEGDEALMLVDVSDPNTFSPTVFPVDLAGVPASANRGEPFTTTVTEYRSDGTPGTGTPTPLGGATVSGGGASATTGSDGKASVAMPDAGAFSLRATKGPERSASVTVCVHDGNDGTCGTTRPEPGDDQATTSQSPPAKAAYRDPAPFVISPARRQRFGAGRGPRRLRGLVHLGTAGLRQVKLRLTRRAGSRCEYYSGRLELFRPTPCGSGYFFKIGDRARWSYLMPERLGPGRYLLEVAASDRNHIRDVYSLVFIVERDRT